MMIYVRDIRRDGGTQFREGLDPAIVAEYTEALRRGEKLTPPVVFGDDNILADGHHTVAAHEAWNPKKKLEVVSMSGTLEDARWYAATQANRNHGSRLSNEAKRRRVAYVLGVKPDLSDREISRECGVSHTFVAAQRAAPSGNVATLPAGGEPTAARLEAADFKPFKPVLWPEGSPTDEDAAADLGIKLTPELAAFGPMFESMAQTGPIRQSAGPGDETIVGDGPALAAISESVALLAELADPPLPLEAQTCLLCLPWKDRYEAMTADRDHWIDRCSRQQDRALAAEAELHTLRNQMTVLQLRLEEALQHASSDEGQLEQKSPATGTEKVGARLLQRAAAGAEPGAPASEIPGAELIIERDPDTGAPTGEESQERRRAPKPAKPPKKPVAKGKGR